MSTDVDGAAPSVTSDPGDEPVPSGPGWLQQEIKRRAARAGSSTGRHARRGVTEPPSTDHEYEPRHGGGVVTGSAAPSALPRLEQSLPPAPRPVPRADWRVRPKPAPATAALPAASRTSIGAGPAVESAPPVPPGALPVPSAFTDPAPPTVPVPVVASLASPVTPVTDPGVRDAPVVPPATAGRPVAPAADAGPTTVSERRPSPVAGKAVVPRTSETLPGMPALTSRPSPPASPATATVAGPGAPSRPVPSPRKRPRSEPPPDAPPADPPAAGPPGADERPEPDVLLDVPDPDLPDPDLPDPDLPDPDLDDDDDVDDGLLDEDLAGEGGDLVLWSATAPPSPVPAPRTSDATRAGLDVPSDPEPRNGARLRSDDAGPQRVRVVLSERKGVTRPVRNVVELQESGAVGDLLRGNLIGSQLGVALRFAVGGGLVLGLLPLLFVTFPEIGRFEVLGFRVPWILLGLLVYPFLFGLGWWFTRVAEHVEQHFADQVQD